MRLALGTAQFGMNYGITNTLGQVKDAESKRIISFAEKNKINILDTAVSYGNSEQKLGEIGIKNFDVVTKISEVPKGVNSKSWITKKVLSSLTLLQKNELYAVLLHRPMSLNDNCGEEIWESLISLKKEGLIKKIGFSIYDMSELDILTPNFMPDIVQTPINAFDNRLVDSGWLTRAFNKKIEVHARSIFLQGLLLQDYRNLPSSFHKYKNLFKSWDKWAKSNNLSLLEASLWHVLKEEKVSKIVFGVNTLENLKEIVLAYKKIINESNSISAFNTKEVDHVLINPSKWGSL